jgi:segregation and condensation protein A
MSSAGERQAERSMYELKLPVFEGPLELLLQLIEKEELDITTVSLVQVTDQYLEHLRSLEETDADALADFISIGAKLLLLKSRALLPQQPGAEEEEPSAEEVGEELTRLLEEYRLFRQAAGDLREMEDRGWRAYPRLAAPPEVELPTGLERVTLRRLLKIVQETLSRHPAEPEGAIEREEITIQQKLEEIESTLAAHGRASFRRLMEACRSRVEIIVSFLAVLELIKAQRVEAEQVELFGDILLVPLKRGESPA